MVCSSLHILVGSVECVNKQHADPLRNRELNASCILQFVCGSAALCNLWESVDLLLLSVEIGESALVLHTNQGQATSGSS